MPRGPTAASRSRKDVQVLLRLIISTVRKISEIGRASGRTKRSPGAAKLICVVAKCRPLCRPTPASCTEGAGRSCGPKRNRTIAALISIKLVIASTATTCRVIARNCGRRRNSPGAVTTRRSVVSASTAMLIILTHMRQTGPRNTSNGAVTMRRSSALGRRRHSSATPKAAHGNPGRRRKRTGAAITSQWAARGLTVHTKWRTSKRNGVGPRKTSAAKRRTWDVLRLLQARLKRSSTARKVLRPGRRAGRI
mmetsp:Transcript_63652/g.129263  ORF Transcript_63652/g.129263 Transcript_63652/m.129263 type:complete len:251 (+) Transcript_63652:763-1515(+)